jgi:hypothetical protein
MKIREIILEDNNTTKFGSNLLPVLSFLYYRSKNKGLTPRIHTASLIQFVQNAGDSTFDYDTLVTLYQTDDAIKNVVDQFELIGEDGEPETFDTNGDTTDLDMPSDDFPPDEMDNEMPPDDSNEMPDEMEPSGSMPQRPSYQNQGAEQLEPHETPSSNDIVSGMASRRSGRIVH